MEGTRVMRCITMDFQMFVSQKEIRKMEKKKKKEIDKREKKEK